MPSMRPPRVFGKPTFTDLATFPSTQPSVDKSTSAARSSGYLYLQDGQYVISLGDSRVCAKRQQNPRTRLNTISPRRLTETGTTSLHPAKTHLRSRVGIEITDTNAHHSIKKPKTHRYPSLKGTDPKFRRNHRHALHGTMKALKEVKEGKRDAA